MAKKKLSIVLSRVKYNQLLDDLAHYERSSNQGWASFHNAAEDHRNGMRQLQTDCETRIMAVQKNASNRAAEVQLAHRNEVQSLRAQITKLQSIARHSVDQVAASTYF